VDGQPYSKAELPALTDDLALQKEEPKENG
jgi:hypothetical protein